MGTGISIKNVEIYHPANKVDNEYYIDYFNGLGKDIKPFLKAMGRESRYISDEPDENVVSMGLAVANKALKQANLLSTDLDMLVFCSGTPEYLIPSNAAMIHGLLKGKKETIVFDLNANCVGMVVAFEVVGRYMKANSNIKHAMILGSEQMNKYTKPSDMSTIANFGDGASAVILEQNERQCGIIDSTYLTDTFDPNAMTFPDKGLSNALLCACEEEDRKIFISPEYSTAKYFEEFTNMTDKLLKRNGLSTNDIKKYFVSQLSLKHINMAREILKEDTDKFTFVGDEFGYTGACSPFFALNDAMEKGELIEDDVIAIWSVGAGFTSCCTLFKL